MKKIHQLLPTFSPLDAVGNETCVIQDELRKMGYESKIFSQDIHPSLKNRSLKYTKLLDSISKNDILIYHHSIGWDYSDLFESLPSKLVMIYHNITPPKFFEGVNDIVSSLCQKGISQLDELREKVDLTVTMSDYSFQDLKNHGYQNITLMPILLDKSRYDYKIDDKTASKFKKSKNILYVGRIAPNKQIEQVLRVFYYYNINIEPNSNLFLVGSFDELSGKYYQSLQELIKKVEIKNVHFVSAASDKMLVTMYSIADVFLTMSEHEGFCIPLIESMMYKVPVIANDTSAIPCTLGGSGFLVDDQSFEVVGELIDMIITDAKLRQDAITKQSERFTQLYDKENNEFLEGLLSHL